MDINQNIASAAVVEIAMVAMVWIFEQSLRE